MKFKKSDAGVVQVEDRTVTGFASIFGNVDFAGDIVHPGAFTKTLNEQRGSIKHLWNHGQEGWEYFCTPPIAKILEIKEVSRAELPESVLSKAPEATGGLLVKREYLATSRGDEVLAGLKAGTGLEMSFGYDVVKYDTELLNAGKSDERHVWHLRELRLYDTSDVNFGMNPATVADGSKSAFFSDRVGEFIEFLEWAKRAKSLPQNFDRELKRLQHLIGGYKADGEVVGLFACPSCQAALRVSEFEKSDGDPDPPPPPRENRLDSSRAGAKASLTDLLAELKEVESSL